MSQANSQTNNDMVSRCLKPSQALGLKVSKVVGTNSTGRRNWYLMGQRMSPKCVVACLGLGNFRTMRLQQGKKDRRFRIWGGVPRRIYYFDFKLTHLYLLFFGLLENTSYLTTMSCLAQGNYRCPKKKRSVDRFLLELYIKAAGMLPQKLHGTKCAEHIPSVSN